ncbi:SLC13 family permease [Leptospira sp. 96542]|nr:SLC13 family permease [Leptospira sp. 96542]
MLSIVISIGIVYLFEVPTGIVFLTLTICFLMFGLIETGEYLASFFDETLLTISALIFISKGLEFNPLVEKIRSLLLKGSDKKVSIKLNFFSMLYSMFVNNAAVVSTMIGILNGRKRQQRLFLMSISFASILGGMLTLVGTSTNLIVNNLKIRYGFESWSLLSFFEIGITPAVLGFIYLSFAPRKYIDVDNSHDNGASVIEALVKKKSKLIGNTIESNGLRNLKNFFLGELVRSDGTIISPAKPSDVIEFGDKLIFIGAIADIGKLKLIQGLEVSNEPSIHSLKNLKEVLITDESDLVGLTPKIVQFRSRFNSVVVSVRRGLDVIKSNLGDEIFKPGDQLTLAIGADFEKNQSNILSFRSLEGIRLVKDNQYWKSTAYLFLFLLILVLNIFGLLSLFKGSLIVLIFGILANLLTLNSLKNEIPFNLIMTVGSAFVISNVLRTLQAPEFILANLLPFLLNLPVFVSLFIFFVFVIVLTEFVSNAVAAGIALPFAVSLASGLSTNAEPFFFVTAFGASASFLTPFGYHTNMMIYSVGHYKPSEFFKLGLPLTYIYILTVYVSIIYKFKIYPFNF